MKLQAETTEVGKSWPQLANLLGESVSKLATSIRAGDFAIDVAARSVTVHGQDLPLSGAEFDVLIYLMSHHRQVVSSRTRLKTRTEGSQVHDTEFLRALLSLQKKLHEVVPGAHYLQTEAWILYDFRPGT